jgi:hypothetical protein
MEFHLERAIRQKPTDEIEHKGLYSKALTELDDRGAQVGHDMIPWVWTTSFLATEFIVQDSLRYETVGMLGDEHGELQSSRRTTIQARLHPGSMREGSIFDREPTYRFFGTDRVIKGWQLHILPTETKEKEGCTAWGSVSYDSETDFRTETTTDIVTFYLMVNHSLYDRYLWNIAQGLANQLALSVGHVDGFYSEWSPGISTRDIKVLAGSEHKIEDGDGTEWPRLAKVGKAEFYMNGRFDLSRHPPGIDEDQDVSGEEEERPSFRWPGRR